MYRFQYKAYRRSFAGVFSNARESFPKREGLLLRIEDRDGRVGFGEVAPIPSFGTESFASALVAVEEIGEEMEPEALRGALSGYPCLAWGLESALEQVSSEGKWPELAEPWPVCGLVSDLDDMARIEELLQMHFQCLKFKIGKGAVIDEMRALDRFVDLSDGKIQIRLDANGVLDARTASLWLERLAELPVEFLEQPLPKGMESEMLRLSSDFPTPLALDESVGSVDDLKRWRDAQWPGVFVIKPSLSGSYRELSQELGQGEDCCVFSSSLETKIGASNAIGFAIRHSQQRRALGFGVDDLFADRNIGLGLGPFLQNGCLGSSDDFERLWNLT
ncbi:o-succinylbenzoate synthase [Pelagicoccus mobilis]|uniref:o-succinylbenzoate synthase n=1 Tax=Pelagicoccus mobilis TaxID=415221 RepID=A0A934VQK7_9BACT|nr:o-succinylbenzoate synthase [Pelagicoccus mobilis]MBK1877010.1 o-succinylbenzoate synthase [Pelagicoccus mobilis]